MSRLTPERLEEITGYTRPRYQAAWFKRYFGVVVPCDRLGPIMTMAAYEALLARTLGISMVADGNTGRQRPTVKLIKGTA